MMLESAPLSRAGRKVAGFGLPVYQLPPCSTWTAVVTNQNPSFAGQPIMPPGFGLISFDSVSGTAKGEYAGPAGTFPQSFQDTNGGPFWIVQSYSTQATGGATWNGSACVDQVVFKPPVTPPTGVPGGFTPNPPKGTIKGGGPSTATAWSTSDTVMVGLVVLGMGGLLLAPRDFWDHF